LRRSIANPPALNRRFSSNDRVVERSDVSSSRGLSTMSRPESGPQHLAIGRAMQLKFASNRCVKSTEACFRRFRFG
jgi:hypothetical protein